MCVCLSSEKFLLNILHLHSFISPETVFLDKKIHFGVYVHEIFHRNPVFLGFDRASRPLWDVKGSEHSPGNRADGLAYPSFSGEQKRSDHFPSGIYTNDPENPGNSDSPMIGPRFGFSAGNCP